MNILRKVKLIKLSDGYDSLSDKEKLFFSFFTGLHEAKGNTSLHYYNDAGFGYFEYNINKNKLTFSWSLIGAVFQREFDMNYSEICTFIENVWYKNFVKK